MVRSCSPSRAYSLVLAFLVCLCFAGQLSSARQPSATGPDARYMAPRCDQAARHGRSQTSATASQTAPYVPDVSANAYADPSTPQRPYRPLDAGIGVFSLNPVPSGLGHQKPASSASPLLALSASVARHHRLVDTDVTQAGDHAIGTPPVDRTLRDGF